MLTHEQKQALYSQARDDAERQRLLAAFRSDPKTESMRDLFELLAGYLLIGAAGLGAAWVAANLLSWAFPLLSPANASLLGAVVFFCAVLGIFVALGSKHGADHTARLDLMARRYGYPLTLVAGLLFGWYAYGYTDSHSEEGAYRRALATTCESMPACARKAGLARY